MLRSLRFALGLLAPLALVPACSGSANVSIPEEPGEGGAPKRSGAPADAETPTEDDAGDPGPVRARALGTIVVGELHPSGGASTAVVTATFSPSAPRANEDAAPGTRLAGCEIVASAAGSAPPPGAPEAFDAGRITFTGTAAPVSLVPPYRGQGVAAGAPFSGGAELRVRADGAEQTGFAPFDERFVATQIVRTRPSLDELPRAVVFGRGPLRLGWVPGGDRLEVVVAGAGGLAVCAVEDAQGTFEVAREVLDRVQGTGAALAVSVGRRRVEERDGFATKGTLPGGGVEPIGRLELVTSSTETRRFDACPAGRGTCGDACVDHATDAANCGACGVVCGAGKACERGACVAVCERGPETTLARCSDGCSNDGDVYVDCDDYDCCAVRKDCPATTACGRPR